MPPVEVAPTAELAPPRGRYSRAASPATRSRDARTRLLGALIECWDFGEELTVAHVCARSGTGRNTFYAHFGDIAHAERAARIRAGDALRAALDAESEPPTPLERIRALVAAWVCALFADPTLARFSLRAAEDGSSIAGEVLRARLTRAVAAASREGALPSDEDGSRVSVALGAVEALYRVAAPTARDATELGRRAGDLVLRNLR